jgi:photosystem II stability/assembly factor-like uncharacterized protein
MKNYIIIGLLVIFGLASCRKSNPTKQDINISFPFKNANIEMTVASENMPKNIWDIHFFNEATGIAMTYDGKVFKTTDKGITWTLKFTNTTLDQPFYKILFKDQNTGYIVGGNSGCGGTGCTPAGGIVIKTIDAGETWNIIYQVSGMVDFKSIAINSNGDLFLIQNGYTSNSTSQATILKSNDEGLTWTKNATVNLSVYKIAFNNNVGYLTGGVGNATIIRSTDNGTTWNDTKTFTGNWVGDISSFNNSTYCLVDGINLYKTIDNGNTWQIAYQNKNYNSGIINALTDKSCILWGTGEYTGGCFGYSFGAFRQSVDGGNNWADNQLKEIGNINTTSFYSSTEGYILSGKLIKVKTNPE